MATIAKLNTMFTADGSAFNAVANSLANRTKMLDKNIAPAFKNTTAATEKIANGAEKSGSALGSLAKFAKVAAVAVAGLVTIQFIAGIVNGIVETYRFARSIGTSTTELYAMQQAFRDMGADVADAGPMLQDLARSMSAASTGGNAGLADTLGRIGLSAQKLQGMNPSQQFREIAQALSQVQDANQRAALATQIFGDRAALLMPQLSKGAAGMDEAAARADAMGNAIDDKRAAQIEMLVTKWENFKATITGVGVTLAGELVPWLTALAEKLPSLGVTAGAVTTWIRGALNTMGGFMQFLQGIYQAAIGTGKGIQFLFTAAIAGWLGMISKGLGAINALSQKLTGKKLIDTTEIDALFKGSMQVAKEYEKETKEAFSKIGEKNSLQNFAAMLDEIKVKADDNADKVKKAFQDSGAVQANVNGALFKKGLDVFNETRTPLEKFSSRMTEMDALVKSGAISWDTYARSSQAAVNELEKAYELTRAGFSAATRAGTTEAYSLIAKAEQQEEIAREDPQKRMVRLMEQSQQIDRGIRAEAKRTADAIQNMKVVKI